ncbi:hypothetical protein GCM10009678_05580 [Actinomadura kijaniata]
MPRNTRKGALTLWPCRPEPRGDPWRRSILNPVSFYPVTGRKVALTDAVWPCGGRTGAEVHPPIHPRGLSGL